MNVLVTGGAGFIGSHLQDALVAAGQTVRVLDDFSTGSRRFLNPAAELIQGDVGDESVAARAMRGAELVFHQAAHRAVMRSVEHPLATDRANTRGTLVVLKAALESGVRRVVYASSSSVYGDAEDRPTLESVAPAPRSPYAVSKLAGEYYCRVFTTLHGLETVSLRYFNVYGPRQRPNSAYAAVVPLFIQSLLRGAACQVHGDGHQSRDFTYIDDVVTANLAAAKAPAEACAGKVYNIAGGDPHSILELLETLGQVLRAAPEAVHTDPRPGDVRHTHADIGAARRDLRHEPRVALKEGLSRTVAWFERGTVSPVLGDRGPTL